MSTIRLDENSVGIFSGVSEKTDCSVSLAICLGLSNPFFSYMRSKSSRQHILAECTFMMVGPVVSYATDPLLDAIRGSTSSSLCECVWCVRVPFSVCRIYFGLFV